MTFPQGILLVTTFILILILAGTLDKIYNILIDIRRTIMSQFTDLKSLIDAVKTATDTEAAAIQSVSDRIDRIIASIPTDGMTAEQVAALKTELGEVQVAQTASIDRLTVLGKDPENPIPGV